MYFYLRLTHVGNVTFYTYWDYKQTVNGVIRAKSRDAAKRRLRLIHTTAEFYR